MALSARRTGFSVAAAGTYVIAVNETFTGILKHFSIYEQTAATLYIRITIDGVVFYDGLASQFMDDYRYISGEAGGVDKQSFYTGSGTSTFDNQAPSGARGVASYIRQTIDTINGDDYSLAAANINLPVASSFKLEVRNTSTNSDGGAMSVSFSGDAIFFKEV